MKVSDILKTAADSLSSSGTPRLDAQVLTAHILNKSRAWLMAHLDEDLAEEQKKQFELALKKLGAGEPLPYVLGEWEFFGLKFDVTKDVLIPRPETELLVEKAIAHLRRSGKTRIADIGTGSGAIAISLAAKLPNAQILAADISPAALQVAQRNAKKHNVQSQIQFVECDLIPNSEFKILNSEFDLLCANLPYIPTETLRGLDVYNREPTLALDGGLDGLDLFRKLFTLAPPYLAPRALMLLEIESTLGAETLALAAQYFHQANINLRRDLAKKERLLEIQMS